MTQSTSSNMSPPLTLLKHNVHSQFPLLPVGSSSSVPSLAIDILCLVHPSIVQPSRILRGMLISSPLTTPMHPKQHSTIVHQLHIIRGSIYLSRLSPIPKRGSTFHIHPTLLLKRGSTHLSLLHSKRGTVLIIMVNLRPKRGSHLLPHVSCILLLLLPSSLNLTRILLL